MVYRQIGYIGYIGYVLYSNSIPIVYLLTKTIGTLSLGRYVPLTLLTP